MLKHLRDPLHPPKEWPTDLKLKCEVGPATLVALSPRASYAAAGLAGGTLVVFDTDTWSVILRTRRHAQDLIALQWSSDGRFLTGVGQDWFVCVWDLVSVAVVRTKQLDVCPLAVSFRLGSHLAFVLATPSQLWAYELAPRDAAGTADAAGDTTADTCVELAAPDLDKAQIMCVCCLKNGALAVGTSKGMMHVYVGSGIAHSLRLTAGALRCFAYAPQGNVLAVSCGDRSVRAFYLGDPLVPRDVAVGHRFTDLGLHSQFNALALSADGEYLYAAADLRQGTVAVWNTFTRFAVRHLTGHFEQLASVQFDADRVMLVGAGRESGAVYVWRAEPPKAWAHLIPSFEHIPDLEVFHETEDAWDVKVNDVDDPAQFGEPVDVWTLPDAAQDAVIPVEY